MRVAATYTAVPASATNDMLDRFLSTRATTLELASPLSAEDMLLQSMDDASPTKWHLAHTTWFLENFLLASANRELLRLPPYQVFHPDFSYLFNSYYNAVGDRHPRPARGMLSRPSAEQVFSYRKYVDDAMAEILQHDLPSDVTAIIELGIQHEQQHQELVLTDIKHALSLNPLKPAMFDISTDAPLTTTTNDGDYLLNLRKQSNPSWYDFPAGIYEIGFNGTGFCFDNELPRHRVFLESFWVSTQPVTCGEYLQFMQDGGYREPKHWLSEGWDTVQSQNWDSPLYWFKRNDEWFYYTLTGVRPIELNAPVSHVSYYEADAYARWSGNRLPTEFEWEVASSTCPSTVGNFLENRQYHPVATFENNQLRNARAIQQGAAEKRPIQQLFGDVWEWTSSAYAAYPGYRPQPGALGEYNGKFMCSQFVLKGGSCVTPSSHIRATYRNFFHPSKRWQFSGIRLAKSP